MNSGEPCILWSCVERDNYIFSDAKLTSSEFDDTMVDRAANELLKKPDTPGWEFTTMTFGSRLRGKARKLKGMKFHIYDFKDDGEYQLWVYACVYNPLLIPVDNVKSFLEKVLTSNQRFRDNDDESRDWSDEKIHALISPTLEQNMRQAKHDIGKVALLEEQVENLKQKMHENIEKRLENDAKIERLREKPEELNEMAKVFKKSARNVKRKVLWQKARYGVLIVAPVVVFP